MRKKYKILMIVIISVAVILGGLLIYQKFFYKETVETPVNTVTVTNTIDEYGYTLEDRDTALFEEKFHELETLLNQEEFDQEEYVSLVSQLFIIDFYTIDNKISRYDIGGLEYVYTDAVASLKSVAQNSIYKTVENNLDNTRTQDLPEVASITVDSISDYEYIMPDESTVSGYRVALSWTYTENLGYDTEGVLVLIPDGNKVGVVYFNPWENFDDLV